MKVLVAVDLQNDFINGALGTAEAAAILPRAERKIRSFEGLVLFTRDTHTEDYLNTREGKALPVPHCIRGSHGWQLAARLLPRGIDVIAAGDRQGDMELAVALERLDGDTPGTARLQARWQLSRGGEALDRGIYAASEDAGMSSASLVAAQSRLLQGLGEHLAERLLPRLKGGR